MCTLLQGLPTCRCPFPPPLLSSFGPAAPCGRPHTRLRLLRIWAYLPFRCIDRIIPLLDLSERNGSLNRARWRKFRGASTFFFFFPSCWACHFLHLESHLLGVATFDCEYMEICSLPPRCAESASSERCATPAASRVPACPIGHPVASCRLRCDRCAFLSPSPVEREG